MNSMPNVLTVGNSLFLKTTDNKKFNSSNPNENAYINLSKATQITIDSDRKTVKAFYADINSGYSDMYGHQTFKCENLSNSELTSLNLNCLA